MIEIRNISKNYEKKLVLDNINTTIPKGKITAFIGPNGAGKSTLLGVITRILKADNGSVVIDGVDINGQTTAELAKKMSVLKQQNNIQVRLTVRELVSFGRYPYSKGKLTAGDKGVIDSAIDYMELAALQYNFIDQLSGGERQRAFIAMVVAQDTEYIFLDEPLNNLDMKHSVEIMQMLRRLCKEQNKTVIIVIHDINFASCYADHILALKENKVYINDTSGNVIAPAVLKEVYDMDFNVCDINGSKICVYYNNEETKYKAAI